MRKLFTAILLLPLNLLAADTIYVRDGGTGSGAAWNDALDQLPSTLTRGNTYYIADGTYTAWTLDDNSSGSTYIYIKKATVADHGTSTGWSDAYGDGMAIVPQISFASPPSGNGGYYDINGYSSGQSRSCGIRIDNGAVNCSLIDYAVYDTGHHPYCNYSYLELAGPYGEGDYDAGDPPYSYGMYIHGNNPAFDTSHTTVSHCWIHGVTTCIQDNSGNNYFTVEYTEMSGSRNTGSDHGNIYWVGSSYGTLRYNLIHNYNTEGILMGLDNTGWAIYGNVFYDGASSGGSTWPRGIELYGGKTHTGTLIYNNTFVNLVLAAIRVESSATCSGVQIYNNLTLLANINLENGGTGVTLRSNLTASSSWFTSTNSDDYTLSGSTTAGFSLSSPYNADMLGTTRGADGTWDVGAYEFSGATTNPPTITSTSDVTGTNGVAFSYSVTVTDGATSYGATNLPAGLSINASSGLVTGSPSATVTNLVGLFATNANGWDYEGNTFTILPPAPAIWVSAASLDWGYLATNTTSDLTLVVSNAGPGTMTGDVSGISSPWSAVGTTSYAISGTTTKTLTLRYSPTAVGTNYDSWTVTGDGGVATITSYGKAFPMVATSILLTNALTETSMSNYVAGNYVFDPVSSDEPEDGGRIVVGYNAASAGTIKLWTLAHAPDSSVNSLFVNVIATNATLPQPSFTNVYDLYEYFTNFSGRAYVHQRGTGDYSNPQFKSNAFPVAAGTSLIVIRGREANTQLRELNVEFTADTPPAGTRAYITNLRIGQ